MENKLKLEISDDFVEKTRKEVAEGQHALLVAMRERRKEQNIRPPKELLQVFLDNQDLFDTGLCRWTARLKENGIITDKEEEYVDGLLENEPGYSPISFLWRQTEIEPRLNWLKENLK